MRSVLADIAFLIPLVAPDSTLSGTIRVPVSPLIVLSASRLGRRLRADRLDRTLRPPVPPVPLVTGSVPAPPGDGARARTPTFSGLIGRAIKGYGWDMAPLSIGRLRGEEERREGGVVGERMQENRAPMRSVAVYSWQSSLHWPLVWLTGRSGLTAYWSTAVDERPTSDAVLLRAGRGMVLMVGYSRCVAE